MIRHQAEGQEDPPEAVDRLGEYRDVAAIVVLADEQRPAIHSPRPDVERGAGKLDPPLACHRPEKATAPRIRPFLKTQPDPVFRFGRRRRAGASCRGLRLRLVLPGGARLLLLRAFPAAR